MDHQRLHVRNIGEKRENLQIVDELVRLCLSALDIKGEDGAAAIREVFLVKRVLRMIRERRMASGVGDEGGFAPDLRDAEEALALICEAIKKAGYQVGT